MKKILWVVIAALLLAPKPTRADHENGPYEEIHGIENPLTPIPEAARGKAVGGLETCGKYFVNEADGGIVSFTARVLFKDRVNGNTTVQDFLLYGDPRRLVLSFEEKEIPTAEFFIGENGRRRIILRIKAAAII